MSFSEQFLQAKKEFDNSKYSRAKELFLLIADDDWELGEEYSNVQYYLGRCEEFENNYSAAFKYFFKAAEKSSKPCSQAKNALGRFYFKGYGVEVDYQRAYDYFVQGADKNNGTSQYYAGLCHKENKIANASDKKAFEFLTQSAKNGIENGKIALADCYANGIGTQKDVLEAYKTIANMAKNDKAQFKAAEYAIELEEYATALEHLSKVEENGNKNWKDKAQQLKKQIESRDIPNAILQKIKSLNDNEFPPIEEFYKKYGRQPGESLYDMALNQDKNGEFATAAKLYVLAAAAGCKKAAYSLSNMAAHKTLYFDKMIDMTQEEI